jgi:hypothetical protein
MKKPTKETPMERIHQDEHDREQAMLDLDEIVRQGARRMLAEALEAEVRDYIEAAREQRDEHAGAPWWSETATQESARSSAGQAPWRSKLRGSTTNGWTRTVSVGDSRA